MDPRRAPPQSTSLRRRFRLCTGLVTGALALGTSGWGEEPWPVYLHDNQHSGRASAKVDPGRLASTPSWSAPFGYSAPLVVGETVYAMRSQFGHGDDITAIAAFDLRSGEMLWESLHALVFPSALAWHDGRLVYVGFEIPSIEGFLFVRDADTGALLYDVPVPNAVVLLPTLHEDQASHEVVAFLAAPAFTNFGMGPNMTAVTLGKHSGSVKWSDPTPRDYGNASFPTIVGDSLIVTGPAHYFAYRLEDGVANEFHRGSIYGGGGATAAYDPERRQFYIVEVMGSSSFEVLSAWRFEDNDDIELAWTFGADRWMSGNGVAIDEDGYVWTSDYSQLLKIDPADGTLVDSADGQFGVGLTPIVAGDLVWTFQHDITGSTIAYDRHTLEEVRRLPGSRGSLNSAFGEPCAIADGAFLLEYQRLYDATGFAVFLEQRPCGDPVGPSEGVTAVDALQTLRVAVGTATCAGCVCDVNDSGEVTAVDALVVLQRAVGLAVTLGCPDCG